MMTMMTMISTVRVENKDSQKMMEECGFTKSEGAAIRLMVNPKDDILGAVQVKAYTLNKKDYPEKCGDNRFQSSI